jgi:hypothetical protein
MNDANSIHKLVIITLNHQPAAYWKRAARKIEALDWRRYRNQPLNWTLTGRAECNKGAKRKARGSNRGAGPTRHRPVKDRQRIMRFAKAAIKFPAACANAAKIKSYRSMRLHT